MPKQTPTAPRSLGRALNFASGAGNAVCTRLLEPHDLTLAQWAVLQCLWRNGPLGVKALAELTGNAPPATSRLVDRMVNTGLLLRDVDPQDRRAVTIDLTDRAEALRPLQGIYRSVNDVLTDGLSTEEVETLFRLLTKAEANGRDWLKAAPKPDSSS